MGIKYIHTQLRRCLLSDAGVRNYYLEDDNSLLKAGTAYQNNQQAAASTDGVTVKGSFNGDEDGKYVYNVSKDFYAYIKTATADTLTCHPPMQELGTNWGEADGTTASKLVDSTATFSTDGITAGMIACSRDLSQIAVITAVDSETQLSLDSDIFVSGDKYSIMPAFEVSDEIQIGTAVFDGTDGQVMVEIPKFWYKHTSDGTETTWDVHHKEKAGYDLFYPFNADFNGGTEKDYIYVAAFEGSVSTARNFDSPTLTSENLTTAKLTSLPSLTPLTYGQRSEFRQVTENRGTGWHQWDQAANFALQLLFMIETETLNSQSLYDGVTDWSTTDRDNLVVTPADNRSVQQTGNSLTSGNATVMSGVGGDASQVFSYRGVENFYGNIWKFTDGFNVNANAAYFSFDPADYADDTTTNYIDPSVTMPGTNGYIDGLHNTPYGLIPSSSGGGSTTYLPDYYYQSTSWRVALSGGNSAYGALAGFAALNAGNSSSARYSSLGSRACFS